MSAQTGSDRSAVAARYAANVRDGLRRRGKRQRADHRRLLNLALSRAAWGVLRYSDDRVDRELALDALLELALEAERQSVAGVAVSLRAAGATIDDETVEAAAQARARPRVRRDLEALGIPERLE